MEREREGNITDRYRQICVSIGTEKWREREREEKYRQEQTYCHVGVFLRVHFDRGEIIRGTGNGFNRLKSAWTASRVILLNKTTEI